MRNLNVGVVGLGLGYHHATAYDRAEVVKRLVLCDPDTERLRQTQTELPKVTAVYQDLDAMLAAEHLDAVSIVTPDHLHRPHAEACLRAGCHVLLTKPLATNLADGRAIIQQAEAHERKLMVAHERRFRVHIMRIKEYLQAGVLGDIIHLRIDTIQDKRGQFQRSPWYASAEAGRTALVGTGIHQVDLLRYLIDRPITSVFAFSNRLGTLAFPAAKTTATLYQFEGGAIGQVTVTYEAHRKKGCPSDTDFHLVGSRGVVMGDYVTWDEHGDWEQLPQDERGIVTGTFGCVGDFLEAIQQDRPVAISGREAYASLAACVAADEAATTGKPTVPVAADF